MFIKGFVVSVVLVLTSGIISVLNFTSECENEEKNKLLGNKILGGLLVFFSVMSGVLERILNKKVLKVETENEELKTIISRSQVGTERNEPIINPDTEKSDDTKISIYPQAIKFEN